MTPTPTKGRFAPKGAIELAREALLVVGDQPLLDIRFVDTLIVLVATEYNKREKHFAERRDDLIKETANVVAAAAAYAHALQALADLSPGYMALEIKKRKPSGERSDVSFLGIPIREETNSTKDDVDVAFGPELNLPDEHRPAHILLPTIQRARALSRLVAQQRRVLGETVAGVGRVNDARDGRNAKDTLVEACFLLVAGCFGPSGTAKISSKRGPFPPFVAAVQNFARGENRSSKAIRNGAEPKDNPAEDAAYDDAMAEENFERTFKKILPAMRRELRVCGAWHNWIWLNAEPTATPLVALMAAVFANRLFDPKARPPA